jgi:hypothetical protein
MNAVCRQPARSGEEIAHRAACGGESAGSDEHADLERHPVTEADSGEVEVLPDGSISIPVFQEELVIEKRMVVRERVIVRKHTVSQDQLVEADLRKERVALEVDPQIADRVAHEDRRSWGSSSGDKARAQAAPRAGQPAPATTIQGGAA